MSGPVPVFDATAVCWRMSSQPTKSTRVSMPVVCWNFAVLARKMVSSGSTKRAGRRMRKVAPFSIGSFGAATSARGIGWAATRSASAASAAPPAARRNVSRRVMMYVIEPSQWLWCFRSALFCRNATKPAPGWKGASGRQFGQRHLDRPAAVRALHRGDAAAAPTSRRRARRRAGRADRRGRAEQHLLQRRVAAEMAARLVRNADALGRRRNCASRRISSSSSGIGQGWRSYCRISMRPALAVEGEVIALDRHEGVERIGRPARRSRSGSPRSSCRGCRSPRGTRRRRGNSRPRRRRLVEHVEPGIACRCRSGSRTRPRARSPCSAGRGTVRCRP